MNNSEWTRLSPIAIAYFIIKFTVDFFRQGILNILPGVAVFIVAVENKLFWLSVSIPILLVFIVISALLYYLNFKFKVTNDTILVNRGFFKKEKLNLELTRVQNVNISVPFYFSPFQLVNCIVDSAGSSKSEVNLPGVSKEFAEEIRSKVFSAAGLKVDSESALNYDFNQDSDAQAQQDKTPILTLSNWESAKSGLTSYFAVLILAVIAPMLEKIIAFMEQYITPVLMNWVKPVVGSGQAATLLVLAIICAVLSCSVISAFFRFYNFELYDQKDKLMRVSGLLERHAMSMPKIKIQSVLIRQNLIAKLLNRVSLSYRQLGGGMAAAQQKKARFQIPMLKPSKAMEFVHLVFPKCLTPEFSSIHIAFLWRTLFFFCFVPAAITAFFISYNESPSYYFLLGVMPISALIFMRYKRYGFCFNADYGVLRSGLLGKDIVFFPMYKIQKLTIKQSFGQRRLNVGNLHIQLGSGTVVIPYVPMKNLYQFSDMALYQIEVSEKAWM